MSGISKSFTLYGGFKPDLYYMAQFDSIASTLFAEVALEESKENIGKIINLLSLEENNYELIFKHWNVEDSSNADFSLDFPYKYLFKSKVSKSIITISLMDDTLEVGFYYDCKDLELEKEIIELNHRIRTNMGLLRAPTFKVLTKNRAGFQTEDVRTEKIEIDIDKHYNSDFKPEFSKITASLLSKKSGLILLYGKPGTGKTTFIKSLISKDNRLNFIFIQNEFVNTLLDPDFISFLLKQRNSILIIEDAEKVITSRETLKEESVVSTILQLTDGLFSDYLNVKIICTFNTSLSKIDSALLRKGRMISKYEFKELDINKTNALLEELNLDSSNSPLSISDIFNRADSNYDNITPNQIGFKI